jgi:hypothetical protein
MGARRALSAVRLEKRPDNWTAKVEYLHDYEVDSVRAGLNCRFSR